MEKTGTQELTAAQARYIEADRQAARNYQILGRGQDTWRNDAFAWQDFSNYLGSADPWAAKPEDIAAHIANLAERNFNPSTIARRLSSLRFYYGRLGKGFEHGRMGAGIRKDNPVNTEVVRATMRGIRHVHGRAPDRREPILLDSLEKIIERQPETLRGIRNRAILSLGWAAAARLGEISALDIGPDGDGMGYVEFRDDGLVVVFKRRKYSRPEDGWQHVGIPARPTAPDFCPMVLLKRWIEASGIEKGPLFRSIYNKSSVARPDRMHFRTIIRLIKSAVATIGLPPEKYSGKSLRSGCITWLTEMGVSPLQIMKHSGHRSMHSLQFYIHPQDRIENSPLAKTPWARTVRP